MPSTYLRPERLDDALRALAGKRPPLVLAGGTDVYPARVGRPPEEDVLDLTALGGLRGVALVEGRWRLGALTSWTELAEADGLPPVFAGLRQAAREVGGRQIQNAGTLGGNLCTASPAADGAPNLLALDARVELASAARGRRELPLDQFLLGYRLTARRPDELLTAILVPAPRGPGSAAFLKLGARRHLVISIVSVALALELAEDGTIARAGVAVGACAPVPRRLPELEARLLSQRLGSGLARAVDVACLAPLSPIDDIRGAAAYRLDACLTLLRRGLTELGAGGAGAG